nr:uncharacterized protein LOC109150426 [Ipomoea trifida]
MEKSSTLFCRRSPAGRRSSGVARLHRCMLLLELGSNPKAPKRKAIHDRLGVVQDVKNNASHLVKAEPSKRLRSMIPSRMRRETNIHVPCGEVLKVQPRTIVHTRVQKGENEESVGSSDDVVPPQDEEALSFHITLCDETPIEGEDVEDAPHELEEGVRATIDELKEVDLGTPENPRHIFISTLLSNEDEEIYVTLLKEYIDVFAWTYKEMPRLDPKVAVHRRAVKKACRPVKQAQWRFRPELIPSIEEEVNKLIKTGFIREIKYPTWISSIVPVRNKNSQIRVCVDFRDLSVACLKDDFPLPITELMTDAVTRHEIMSFMDGSSGYNQIRMAPEDEELKAFRMPKDIYCYKVMPFGLKNAGATYQRAMQTIFDDMLHKMVECYVDDLVVKSKRRTDHLGHLRKVFERLQKFQLKMNPLKCAFGVANTVEHWSSRPIQTSSGRAGEQQSQWRSRAGHIRGLAEQGGAVLILVVAVARRTSLESLVEVGSLARRSCRLRLARMRSRLSWGKR